jgi:hypothetical protein
MPGKILKGGVLNMADDKGVGEDQKNRQEGEVPGQDQGK